MAEYKNGVNFMGITSVDTEDVTIDIPTGRAVFADPDKYQNDPKYKARVDKYVREGFHLVNEGSGGSGGMDYDIVLRRIADDTEVIQVIQGDFGALYNKLLNREPILGMFVDSYNYYDAVIDDLYPLVYITNVIEEHSLSLGFSKVVHVSDSSVCVKQWNVILAESGVALVEYKSALITSA